MHSSANHSTDERHKNYTDWLAKFPNEVLVELFSYFNIDEATKACGSDLNSRIYVTVQDIWRRRTLHHFPDAIPDDNTGAPINWITRFQEESKVYMNFTPELARLHYELKEGHFSAVMKNLDLPLNDILQMDNKQSSLLSLAKRSNNQRLLNFYYACALKYFSHGEIGQQIDTEMHDRDNNTILHWAILCDQPLDIIFALIAHGCDVNAKNSMGDTSLITAVHCGRIDVVRCLLEYNIDITWKDCNEQSAAYIAAATRRLDILKVLADNGADLLDTAFIHGAPICVATINGDIATVEFLLEHGAGIGTLSYGLTLLHLAVENNHIALARFLLDHGATIDETDIYGRSSIFLATENVNEKMLAVLLERGASINSRDDTGKTPLHHAVEAGNHPLVRFLIASGANPSAADRLERVTPLHLAAKLNDPLITNILLDERVKVNAAMKNGTTPLFVAAYYGQAQIVARLLKKGANLALAKNNSHKLPLLYVAAMNGHVSVVNVLLKHGVDINETCMFGRTALYAAVKRGHIDAARRLLEQGANPDLANDQGRSPLHIAAKRGDVAMMKLLLTYHADADTQLIRSGLTALDLAVKHGHQDVIQLIKGKIEDRKLENQLETDLEASAIPLASAHQHLPRLNRVFEFFSRCSTVNSNHNNDSHHRHRR